MNSKNEFYVLLVIDMQPYFAAANNHKVLAACKQEIKRAMARNSFIFFVEYVGCKSTTDTLTSLTESYPRVAYVTKHANDGSRSIDNALRRRGMRPTRFRVCGVNTDICVLATVRGLAEKLPHSRIEIAPAACGTGFAACGTGFDALSQERGLKELQTIPNVYLNNCV